MANERDNKYIDEEEVYNKSLLDQHLLDNNIDAFRDEFLGMRKNTILYLIR